MSVTIADLLRLPCLREAKVLGGRGGLEKTVNTISVLEGTVADDLQEYLLNTIEFLGSELVITCFVNIKNDVNTQCLTMRRLSEVGEVGLILYYVGIILPKVDDRLIELADSLDFPLICMPENHPNLRYSEAISEVMNAIIKDQMTDTYFQAEILERISRLPVYQRSIGTAMSMLSDRVRVSLLLTDASGNLLNSVYWPRTLAINPEELITRYNKGDTAAAENQALHIRHCLVNTAAGSRLGLYVVKQDEAPKDEDVGQIGDVLRICINIWNQKHGAQALPELVQAILKDEPFRMRRIAKVFNIDVASIHTMWIITPLGNKTAAGKSGKDLQLLLSLIREELSPWCKTIIADIYNQDIVAFMDNPVEGAFMSLADSLERSMTAAGIRALLTVCLNLKNATQVRRVYLQNKNALNTARAIYPRKKIFTRQEIDFAENCQNLISRGEEAAALCLSNLDCLDAGDPRQLEELRETLAAYLLDAESSLDRCAEYLYLHRNSIKYRITNINNRLGFKIGRMPETMEIYTAAAVWRILESRSKPE
jgi:DNA-binding PucR family transcriptional regulator